MSHTTSVRTYAFVLGGLLMLTALTTAVAFVNLGPFNAPVALAIAVAKATLVVLVFMHVRESTRLTIAVIVSALVWMAILVGLTLNDYLTRRFLTFG
jgi:cytochrome c oxidase subunit 4